MEANRGEQEEINVKRAKEKKKANVNKQIRLTSSTRASRGSCGCFPSS